MGELLSKQNRGESRNQPFPARLRHNVPRGAIRRTTPVAGGWWKEKLLAGEGLAEQADVAFREMSE